MSGFEFNVVSGEEAQSTLNDLRSGRGGRVSKYEPIRKHLEEELTPTTAMRLTMDRNEVGGFRGYLNKYHDEKYDVKSSKIDDKHYRVFVFINPDWQA